MRIMAMQWFNWSKNTIHIVVVDSPYIIIGTIIAIIEVFPNIKGFQNFKWDGIVYMGLFSSPVVQLLVAYMWSCHCLNKMPSIDVCVLLLVSTVGRMFQRLCAAESCR